MLIAQGGVSVQMAAKVSLLWKADQQAPQKSNRQAQLLERERQQRLAVKTVIFMPALS